MSHQQADHAPEALRAEHVSKAYGPRRGPRLHALDGVDLQLHRGEILGLVGESGSGKSTLAKILAGAIPPSSGHVFWSDHELPAKPSRSMRQHVQMIFQDPYSSLNPRMTVRTILAELLHVHHIVPPTQVEAEMCRLMGLVGLDNGALDAYPRQFSGGQRQRIAIARALAVRPDVLIADEPVSALDVSIQATILHLFESLRAELGVSILFIAHNLAVVQHTVDRIAVMYLGRVVEAASTRQLFDSPEHPYTQALIASVPRMTRVDLRRPPAIEGEPPSPINLPPGCRFNPRCPYAQQDCLRRDPPLTELAPNHQVACLYAGNLHERPNNKDRTVHEGLHLR